MHAVTLLVVIATVTGIQAAEHNAKYDSATGGRRESELYRKDLYCEGAKDLVLITDCHFQGKNPSTCDGTAVYKGGLVNACVWSGSVDCNNAEGCLSTEVGAATDCLRQGQRCCFESSHHCQYDSLIDAQAWSNYSLPHPTVDEGQDDTPWRPAEGPVTITTGRPIEY